MSQRLKNDLDNSVGKEHDKIIIATGVLSDSDITDYCRSPPPQG